MIGLDIYDCVCVINSREALNAFAKTRVALGSDLAVVAGPYGAGGAVEIGAAMDGKKKDKEHKDEEAPPKPPRPTEDSQGLKPETEADKKKKRRSLSTGAFKPVFSYVKSRGFYAGIQVDGTVVVERKDANAAFYGERVSVEQIIRGEVPRQSGMWPAGARNLLETLKGAEVGSLKVNSVSPTDRDPTSAGPSVPSAPVASGANAGQTQPPGYVDDGVHRPEVGDVKYR
jgi:SH3 domain-containing YSC84-like protein 1